MDSAHSRLCQYCFRDEPPLQEVSTHPDEGVLVYGLHIEGASWDHGRKRLCDPRPDQMRAPAPIVHFVPETNHKPNPGTSTWADCCDQTKQMMGCLKKRTECSCTKLFHVLHAAFSAQSQ